MKGFMKLLLIVFLIGCLASDDSKTSTTDEVKSKSEPVVEQQSVVEPERVAEPEIFVEPDPILEPQPEIESKPVVENKSSETNKRALTVDEANELAQRVAYRLKRGTRVLLKIKETNYLKALQEGREYKIPRDKNSPDDFWNSRDPAEIKAYLEAYSPFVVERKVREVYGVRTPLELNDAHTLARYAFEIFNLSDTMTYRGGPRADEAGKACSIYYGLEYHIAMEECMLKWDNDKDGKMDDADFKALKAFAIANTDSLVILHELKSQVAQDIRHFAKISDADLSKATGINSL